MILVLDRPHGQLPPYVEWLADSDDDVVLFTAREPSHLAPDETRAYAEVRHFAHDLSGRVELDAIRLAEDRTIRAVVALAPEDAIRAGALRDHLGLAGQGRAEAIALRDLVVLRTRLTQARIPTSTYGAVRRVSDLYRFGARWGYPLRLRHRRRPGWPTVACLKDQDDVASATRSGLTRSLEVVPSLLVEPSRDGDRQSILVRRRAAAAWRVTLVRRDAEDSWRVDAIVAEPGTPADLTRAQAGLPPRGPEPPR